MKRLFTLLLISFAALSCEMIDEKLDDFPGRDDSPVTTIANNQIWYTSRDSEIVEPYSGVDNNYADALTTFGVNIVSNTYVDGKGVIEFDGDVTIIGDYAFRSCWSLTSVTIPDSVTIIGEAAFWCCDSLTSVTIPDSLTTIGEWAFYWCSDLQEFKGKFASEDGRCLIIDGTLNAFAPAGLTEYAIPDSVTTIGDYVFCDCRSLTSVTIPDSVTTIGNLAFWGCDSLTSVSIPDSVTTIGYGAFATCSNLQEFKSKFASEDGRCLIIDGTLNAFARAGLTEYTIPDSVTTIGGLAFYGCDSLTNVTIPDSVTTIGNQAFHFCSSLTSITIPDSVTEIGNWAFSWCESLTSVTIPDSVTTIGYYAFEVCSSLTSVTIPDSVTTIGEWAFAHCDSLTSVYCKAITPPSCRNYMFDKNADDRKIYVPMESVEVYKSAQGWRSYASDIVGYNFE